MTDQMTRIQCDLGKLVNLAREIKDSHGVCSVKLASDGS